MSTGRYAPSPSGRMHLGNLMCCLLAWLSAKSKGGQVLLRIEDLDTQRCPRSYADAIVDDLAWLGLAADGPTPPVYQSDRSEIYQRYFDELSRRGLVYPCFCSRSQLHAASAPHRSDGQVIYAGTCRGLTPAEIAERSKIRAPAWRVQVPDEVIAFEDGHMGHYEENLARDCGDFFLRRADGVFAYQLAVVVDDALMGVDEVVRGSDLLSSTPRQLGAQGHGFGFQFCQPGSVYRVCRAAVCGGGKDGPEGPSAGRIDGGQLDLDLRAADGCRGLRLGRGWFWLHRWCIPACFVAPPWRLRKQKILSAPFQRPTSAAS